MKYPLLIAIALGSFASPARAQTRAQNPHGPVSASGGTSTTLGPVMGFSDRDEWAAATNGDLMLVDFECLRDPTAEIDFELIPFGISGVSGTSNFEDPPGPTSQFVTSSADLPFPMFVAGTLPSETNFISNPLEFPGPAATGTISFDFTNPRTAVGAFIADQAPIDNAIIEIFGDFGTSLGSISIPSGVLPNSFIGLTSTVPFTRATFFPSSDADSFGLDNLEFDQVLIGADYCQSTPNSTGSPASISATGSTSVAENSLFLHAGPVPDQDGLFFGRNATRVPFGNGFRCVATPILRIQPPLPATCNIGSRQVSLPVTGIMPGTLNFQYWFRDPAAGGAQFDLSNGLQIQFVP